MGSVQPEYKGGRYTILHQVEDYPVYIAHDGRRRVALKRQESAHSNEIAVLRAADHPRIVKLRGIVRRNVGDGLHHYAVLEYADGPSLRQLGRLPEDAALRIASQTCDALGYVHSMGLVYNDLKPDNIHCTRRGAKLLDLEGCLPADLEEPERLRGTPGFRCPDQVHGRNYPSNDVFGLGAVMYFLFSGRAPFPELSSSSAWNELDPALQDAYEIKFLAKRPASLGLFNTYVEGEVMRMLSPNRQARPGMDEVREMLKHYARPCARCPRCIVPDEVRCAAAKRL